MKKVIGSLTLVLAMFATPLFADDPGGGVKEAKEVEVIRALGAHLAGLKNFQVEVVDTFDAVTATGQRIQVSHLRSAVVSRPDKVALEFIGDTENRKLVKDAKGITLINLDDKVYGKIPFEGSLDRMMDTLLEKYDISLPLADFLGGDPASSLLNGAYESSYRGIHYAGSVRCHHVAFRKEAIDWQAWVDAGEVPKLQKLVITFKSEVGWPQYTLQLKSMKKLDAAPKDAFVAKIPEGFEQIEFISTHTKSQGEPK